jgi:hypothetical protein
MKKEKKRHRTKQIILPVRSIGIDSSVVCVHVCVCVCVCQCINDSAVHNCVRGTGKVAMTYTNEHIWMIYDTVQLQLLLLGHARTKLIYNRTLCSDAPNAAAGSIVGTPPRLFLVGTTTSEGALRV